VTSLRHLLLVAFLVCAQLAVGVHAIGHAVGDNEAVPTHACELCLAAHDLGSALPSLATLSLLPLAALSPALPLAGGRATLPALPARQGAPPLA